jgi:hypothetical protein
MDPFSSALEELELPGEDPDLPLSLLHSIARNRSLYDRKLSYQVNSRRSAGSDISLSLQR